MRFLHGLRRDPSPPPAPPAGERPQRPPAKLQYLAETDIFRDLPPEQMGAIDRLTTMTTCPRGRTFFTPGETDEVLFIIKRGQVNVYRLGVDGQKLVTASLGAGTVFGEMSFIGQDMQGSFAEAAEACTLCVMSRADLEQVLMTWPAVAIRLLQILARRLEAAEQQLELLAFRGVSSRLAAVLLQLVKEGGSTEVHVTHQALAEQIGTHRETVTRALDDLRTVGLIELGRGHIRICNCEGLRARSRL